MSVVMKKFTNIFGTQKMWTTTGDFGKFMKTMGATDKEIKLMQVKKNVDLKKSLKSFFFLFRFQNFAKYG